MLVYARFVPADLDDFDTALIDTVDHVRGHLSSCVDPDDDEENRMNEVTISYDQSDAGCLVTGSIDADPVAHYLSDDFDPLADDEFEFIRYSEVGRE